MLLLALIGGVWIWANEYSTRFDILELRAEHMAEMYQQMALSKEPLDNLQQVNDIRDRLFVLQIVDRAGNIQYMKKSKNFRLNTSYLYQISSLQHSVLAGKTIHEEFNVDNHTWLRVGVPIYQQGTVTNALYISAPAESVLQRIRFLYTWLALITGVIILAGWLVLYYFSRKLTGPLREMARATRLIARGDYDLNLPENIKEEELQLLVESFSDMASRLKQLEQLRTNLLAGVSHELRTPITSIRGMIQAVQNKVVTGAEAEEFLQISWQETKRLQQIVEELLDFSSFEAGATPIRREKVNLVGLVENLIRQLSILPEYADIEFDQVISSQIINIGGETDRLRQILINLLNNSQKASATIIKINLQVAGEQILLDVQDNGKGIAPSDQPYIFERFYRGETIRPKGYGLGLGLTVSRLLARAHGGDLVLLDTSAQGTTFRIHLPLNLT